MLHYLPGCDVKKNHSEAVLKIENYMKEKEIIIDYCCRVQNKFLKVGDTIINNCTLCDLVLNETHPNNKCLSLYEFILEDNNFPWVNHQGKPITLQDCWRTRDNLSLQKAIRQCLMKMNYTIIEMEENYIVESTSGVEVGGRTGLTAVVTGICFFLSIFFYPVLSIVTNAVTAPALVIVGILMAQQLAGIDWDDLVYAASGFVTIIMMVLCYSISYGIALGFITYAVTMTASGRVKEVKPAIWVLIPIFIIYFII